MPLTSQNAETSLSTKGLFVPIQTRRDDGGNATSAMRSSCPLIRDPLVHFPGVTRRRQNVSPPSHSRERANLVYALFFFHPPRPGTPRKTTNWVACILLCEIQNGERTPLPNPSLSLSPLFLLAYDADSCRMTLS